VLEIFIAWLDNREQKVRISSAKKLWQGVEDYHGLVGSGHDRFGDGD
jgi:hypothetical protein